MAALERVKRDGNAAAKAKAEEALVKLRTLEESVMAEFGQFGPRLLDSANPEAQVKAAEEIWHTAPFMREIDAFRIRCASNGTVPALTKALRETNNDRVREKVCGAIVNITRAVEGKAACVKARSEKVVTAVLETTEDERVRENACLAIYNICARSDEGKAACVRGE